MSHADVWFAISAGVVKGTESHNKKCCTWFAKVISANLTCNGACCVGLLLGRRGQGFARMSLTWVVLWFLL